MADITVQCDWCDDLVEGMMDAVTTPDGEAVIISGGFYLFDSGVICDDCIEKTDDVDDTDSERPNA